MMRRVKVFLFLGLVSLKLLAVDSVEVPTEFQCRLDSGRSYYRVFEDVLKAIHSDRNPQCIYDSYPIFRADVSAEELINREIPSPPLDKKTMAGVCFSGGGSRSLSLTRGGLAALLSLGYESKINYISMVSGGTWGAGSYYALSEYIRQKYLGSAVKDLKSLYWGESDDEDDNNIDWLHRYSLGQAPQKMRLSSAAWHFVTNSYYQGSKLWSEYLKDVLLLPYELDASLPLEESLFAAKPPHMQLIVSAGVKNDDGELIPLEITPVGIGARVPVNGKGNAYILPPEAFGRKALGIRGRYLWVDAGAGFTLGDMQAVTSSNFVHQMPMFWNVMSALGMAVPGFNWLNVSFGSGDIGQYWHQVVDSGPDEYLGLMPLLARGVRKIVAFVNTDIPIVKGEHVIGLEKVIPSYFGIVPDEAGRGQEYRLASSGVVNDCGKYCLKNQVFPGEQYQEVAEHLWQVKMDGEPIVYLQKNLPVLDNAKYGIKGGGLVDILWVYNDLPKDWFTRLNKELQDRIVESGEFLCPSGACQSHGYLFPHYDAMTQLNLSRVQVNMLFHLQVWTLFNSRGKLEELFDVE